MQNPCGPAEATLLVDGRGCWVHAVRGSALGTASGVVVRIDSDGSLAAATSWMPGRIALVSACALTTDRLRGLVGHATDAPFAAVVVLVDERDDIGRLGAIEAAIPVLTAGRPSDRVWLERAVHADLSVHPAGQAPLPGHPVHQRRERHESVTFGEPGTVRTGA